MPSLSWESPIPHAKIHHFEASIGGYVDKWESPQVHTIWCTLYTSILNLFAVLHYVTVNPETFKRVGVLFYTHLTRMDSRQDPLSEGWALP